MYLEINPTKKTKSKKTRCRLCNANKSYTLVKLPNYSILRCQKCSFIFSDLTDIKISKLYNESYFRKEFGPYFSACSGNTNTHLLKSQFDKYAIHLEQHHEPGRVLDVGCAAGLFLNTLNQRGWKAEGVEISSYAARTARHYTNLPIHAGNFSSLNLPIGTYDAVCMLDLIEHLADPASGLHKAHTLLHRKGVLFLVLPNYRNLTTWLALLAYKASAGLLDYPVSKVHQIYHVSYFTPRSISQLLETQGFKTLAILPDETITDLLNEPLAVRTGIRTVFALSRILGLQNKMIVVATPLNKTTNTNQTTINSF